MRARGRHRTCARTWVLVGAVITMALGVTGLHMGLATGMNHAFGVSCGSAICVTVMCALVTKRAEWLELKRYRRRDSIIGLIVGVSIGSGQEFLVTPQAWQQQVLDIVDIVVLAPVGEELLYRGVIWRIAQNRGGGSDYLPLSVSTGSFVIAHSMANQDPLYILLIAGTATVFGILRSQLSLAASVACHLGVNGTLAAFGLLGT